MTRATFELFETFLQYKKGTLKAIETSIFAIIPG